ncbi:MAG: AtpZ/AtpI family protein [Deltaproteobacteria bacterium]|nr:AtpZ/AtpI family protein [Deltaproteobacteria bacterium]MBW1924915.1 AtpZ/AtpI family protein [Deltaproteobacteria bacterium]MBW1949477.1 AtpZ/AtpI family protein [Deltaproteobacteria bacterium]MBW2007611.1 AtpZ/AtpI family protein [Deltaproteobacteria bacterium]MBW2103487.1 AtpZ/AtpI family protein [Deltaproteobacteria bacterium]
MDEDLKKTIKDLAFISTVGLAMAISIALGAFGGYYVDKKFETDPWGLYVGLAVGIAAAFRNLYYMYKKAKDL